MRISDILIKENNNSGQIILHKEGLFWRAYEKSAYLFSINIRKYKIIRKYFKGIAKDVVFLGFPHIAKEDVLNDINIQDIQSDEKQIIITGYQFDIIGFKEWKQSVDLKVTTIQDKLLVSEPQISYTTNEHYKPNNPLLDLIQKFPVALKTPFECQQFIIEIQNQINGSI